MIIAGFAGIGKSHLASREPDKYEDFIARPYRYLLDEDGMADESQEARKADLSLGTHPCWPCNYLNALTHRNGNPGNLLIPSDHQVLNDLAIEGVPFALVYPDKMAKEEYRHRFVERGNSEDFIGIFIGRWESFMKQLKMAPCRYRIILGPGQYLSDVVGQLEEWSSAVVQSSKRNCIQLHKYKERAWERSISGWWGIRRARAGL